LIGWKA